MTDSRDKWCTMVPVMYQMPIAEVPAGANYIMVEGLWGTIGGKNATRIDVRWLLPRRDPVPGARPASYVHNSGRRDRKLLSFPVVHTPLQIGGIDPRLAEHS